MSVPNTSNAESDARRFSAPTATGAAGSILRTGRGLALLGVVLPLLLIGGLKFTQVEVEALVPLISSTPWLAWMHGVFGQAGASYVLGVTEIATALLLIISPWWSRAGVAGGALAGLTFLVTVTLFLTLPAWDERLGGFPALSGVGQFLIKDVALLGISLTVLGESLARVSGVRHRA
ncbi:MAG: DUF417 family protein [Gemmatimonadaceae bacterium]